MTTYTALATSLAVAIALSIVAMAWDRLPGELAMVREVQNWPGTGQSLSHAVRAITTTQIMLITGGVLTVALFLTGRRADAVGLAVALALLSFVQPAIKEIVDRPRPMSELVEIRGSITSPSFPSGHVMSPTVLYGYLLWMAMAGRLHRTVAWATCGFAVSVLALTGIVNVWLGVHWPLDVAGGYAWGVLLVCVGVVVAGVSARVDALRGG